MITSATKIVDQTAIGTPRVIRNPWNGPMKFGANQTIYIVPNAIIVASIEAATCLFTGNPIETNVMPEEYRSKIAPPIKPITATIANGIRYQVGSSVVRAPIGSLAIASPRCEELPASNDP